MMDEESKAFLFAAENGDWSEMDKLLNGGMSIGKGLKKGVFEDVTPLVAVCRNGHAECVKKILLLADAVDQVFVKLNFIEAFVEAAKENHLKCLQLLMEARLFKNYSHRKKKEFGFLFSAAKNGNFAFIQERISTGKVGKDVLQSWKGNSLMSLFLVYMCPVACVQVLMDQGVDINGFDDNGLPPVVLAILAGNIECLHFLLDQGATITTSTKEDHVSCYEDGITIANINSYGRTPLMFAACLKNPKCLSLMLPFLKDKDINIRDYFEWTALTFAVRSGNTESASLLIKSGAQVQISDSCGLNIIHHTLFSENFECVELVLKSVSTENIYRTRCFSNYVGSVNCLRALLHRLDDLDHWNSDGRQTLLISASHNGSLECVRLLLEQGANVDCRNAEGESALMISCSHGYSEVTDLLIQHGADVNAQNENGIAAIMYAACQNQVNSLKKLLNCGANVLLKNTQGETVLMVSSLVGAYECIDPLIQHGADVNAQSLTGDTAVMYASRKYNVECLKKLLIAGAALDIVNENDDTVLSAAINEKDIISCLKVLLTREEIFCNGKLKDVHKKSVAKCASQFTFNLNVLQLTMQYGIFDWNWCALEKQLLESICFAAVQCGLSAGKIKYGNFTVSPLVLAFIKKDKRTIRYLLANLYFFPEDFKNLATDNAIKCLIDTYDDPELSELLQLFTSEPLSLKSWSFLSISKAISVTDSVTGRADKVTRLPLPEGIIRTLQFKSCMSQLCYACWNTIEYYPPGELVLGVRVSWTEASDEFCLSNCNFCQGFGTQSCPFASPPSPGYQTPFSEIWS